MVSFAELLVDPSLQPYLPAIFVFTITYGMLSSVSILKWGKRTNVVLALVFGVFAGGYPAFVEFFYQNFIYLMGFFVLFFMILFAADVFGLRGGKYKGKESMAIFLLGIAILVFLMLATAGFFDELSVFGLEKNDLLLVIGLLFLLLILFFAYEHSRRDLVQEYIEDAMRRQRGG